MSQSVRRTSVNSISQAGVNTEASKHYAQRSEQIALWRDRVGNCPATWRVTLRFAETEDCFCRPLFLGEYTEEEREEWWLGSDKLPTASEENEAKQFASKADALEVAIGLPWVATTVIVTGHEAGAEVETEYIVVRTKGTRAWANSTAVTE